MEIKRKIINWIGRFTGYGECRLCGDTWNWKKSKTIWHSDSAGVFALCEECFNKTPEEDYIFWFYKQALNDIIKENPIEWTRIKINNALRRIKKEIKDEKTNSK